MIYYILCGLGGATLAAFITWFICWKTPKDKIQVVNAVIEEQNHQLTLKNESLTETKTLLNQQILEENEKLYNVYKQIDEATFKLDSVKDEAQKAKEEFLKTNLELAQNELDKQLEIAGQKYQDAEDAYLKEYLGVMADMVREADIQITEKKEEYSVIEADFQNLLKNLTAAKKELDVIVEARKLEQAEASEKDFHRLQLTPIDQEEITTLKTVIPKLRDPIALNKAIWKVYYEKPYTALVGRVVGANKKTGIYKITNINNGMAYVGQAVDIAERWKQHIKRGIGAETPTRNKLYPAMMQEGVENFTFEILIECPQADLNEQEDFYQDMFHCKDYGYSIK